MYSSEDMEKFYFQYQTEAMPNGILIEQFCSCNNILQMVQGYTQQNSGSKGGWHSFFCPRTAKEGKSPAGIFKAENIIFSSYTCGVVHDRWVHISQKDLSYQDLKLLIEKLEGLC